MLLDCLKKAGKSISATDRAALEDAFNEHQGKGLSEYEAGVAALTDFHKGLFDEVNDLRTRARLRAVEYQAPVRPEPPPEVIPEVEQAGPPETQPVEAPPEQPTAVKPAPSPVSEAATTAPPEVPAATTAQPPETKEARLARGVEAKAVQANLTKSFEGLSEYGTVKVADQAERAVKLLTNDPEA